MNKYGYFKVAAAVPSVRVADCQYNAEHIVAMMRRAADRGVRVVVFPELSITGASCGDLLRQPMLLSAAEQALEGIAKASGELGIAAIVGLPVAAGERLFNCAAVVADGHVAGLVPKQHIPNFGEWHDGRWFASGADFEQSAMADFAGQSMNIGCDQLFVVDGVCFGVEIGTDLQVATPPSVQMAQHGAKIIFNLSSEAEMVGKYGYLSGLVCEQSSRMVGAYVYSSSGFGESTTDLAYAGNAFVAENGYMLAYSERFSMEEQLVVADVDVELLLAERQRRNTFDMGYDVRKFALTNLDVAPNAVASVDRYIEAMPFVPEDSQALALRCEEVFSMQSFGLAKRLKHTSCRSAVIGISGGLDSTLALLVAVRTFDMLGYDRQGIVGVTMPGFGTTDRTYQNAVTLIKELGVTFKEIPIAAACRQHFADIGLPEGDRSVTYENAQARERTQILMDVANMTVCMVIGTGDLSELALGWATYNGDQMSMYGVNGSVPKTLVRHIVTWAANNESNPLVARALHDVVATPVSPELLPADEKGDIAQKTEDLVGPYELHDFFLYNFVRHGFSPAKIFFMAQQAFAESYDDDTIKKWMKTFFRRFFAQQFKRSAMPDGVKVGSVSLSPRGDWMMPSDASSAVWMAECEKL